MNCYNRLSGTFVFVCLCTFGTMNNVAAQDNTVSPQTASDIGKLQSQETYALPWKQIPMNDVLWKKRVWRTIDTKDAPNKPLANSADLPWEAKFFAILMQGIGDKYPAYAGNDGGQMTDEINKRAAMQMIASKVDTQFVMDPKTGTAVTRYIDHNFNPETIDKYRIIEDWMYLKDEKRVVVRILAIAPVREKISMDGTKSEEVMWWVYYPAAREYLAQNKVYDPSGATAPINWDEFFQQRNFSDKIDKITGE